MKKKFENSWQFIFYLLQIKKDWIKSLKIVNKYIFIFLQIKKEMKKMFENILQIYFYLFANKKRIE